MADETTKCLLCTACPRCGSTRAAQGPGGCLAEKTCRARRCAARIEAERERRRTEHVGQCGYTTGKTSIRFCQLGEGHTGSHVSNTTEWEGNEQHPIARALMQRTRRKERENTAMQVTIRGPVRAAARQ